ncbi:macrolide 2'-phosphotransferase [Paenibacillus sp. GD4]|uniref:macrolide 2'-phosphotransferase n=1 Tax=Paenibacillus sp. GD4 TaxID=3068890 RepID=UPI002796DA1F|nr:macrolide 2'-phosphotransferase [Paenibacillus sp. GD4]MDQ1910793.1 macrolide 2'-phosphotransferase [Paenibacillus sp. GD4]
MTINHQTNSVQHILELARNHGIEVEPSTATSNESGLDFFAVFANGKEGARWVLRSPRREDVIESAAYEQNVLRLAAGRLPVSVPNWEVHTQELIAYRMLEGTPMATINMETKSYDWHMDPQAIPEAFIQSLAEALAALHGIRSDEALRDGVRVKEPAEVRAAMAEQMNDIRHAFGVSRALWDRWQQWLADETYWPPYTGLVHGDLHPGHILVNAEGKVTGLLDWTEGEVADPAADFTIYYALFGDEGLADLLVRYEKAGGRVWPWMHEHIVERLAAYPVLIGLFALKSGLEEYKVMARHALGVNEQGEELPAPAEA